MIIIKNETDRYNVNAKRLIDDSFESAHTKTSVTVEASPPDNIVTISSVLSMVLVALMLLLTAKKETDSTIWLTLSILCIGVIAFIISKHVKSAKLYKESKKSPKTKVKDNKKKEFQELFDYEGLTESYSALDLSRKVSSLLNKQTDPTYVTALRQMTERLSKVNNPTHILGKVITPIPDLFSQSKRRVYMAEKDDKIIIYDADFMHPLGELIADKDNILSFGEYQNYNKKIPNPGGGRIRQDSIIIEIQGDNEESIFFEFRNEDYFDIRKTLGSRKEVK